MMAICFIFGMLAACNHAGSQATLTAGEPVPLPFGEEIQKVLDDGLKASNGAGVSAAVIVPGYEPWVGVAGYSAIESNEFVLMRPDMLFHIGSVEKNFTAALML
jgi:CubicO group peptidase (beta-lactamase class C family)